jgi:hypothetical protein
MTDNPEQYKAREKLLVEIMTDDEKDNLYQMTDALTKPTRITYESHGIKTEVRFETSDLTVDDVASAFYTILVGSGFHAGSVVDCLVEITKDDN